MKRKYNYRSLRWFVALLREQVCKPGIFISPWEESGYGGVLRLKISLDFEAFEKVPQNHLISALLSIGIRCHVIYWIKCCLNNRRQSVVFNGASSPLGDMPNGVTQGSVLGSLLFKMFINDLDHFGLSYNKKYADGIKLGRKVQFHLEIQ